ncbi:hypothetical protein [Pantoea sp.]|uniref:hypothetical protein n=1 Tax=Pantoea sp. TaxID=69393 RepID=UPI0028AC5BCD|nr:hypothetical protein [Pantoea sp.]
MSTAIKFPKSPEKITLVNHLEATPDGINFMERNSDGMFRHVRIVGYSSAIRQLDSGRFDSPVSDGFNLIAEIELAHSKGWFVPDVSQQIVIWRWLVAAVFFVGQVAKGHIIDSQDDAGNTVHYVAWVCSHGAMPVFPAIERTSLANHVESIAYEHYAQDTAQKMALAVYQSMVEADPNGEGMRLSEWGAQSLEALHDDFMSFIASGETEQRVIH